MTQDISEEAKAALATARYRQANERLRRDGGESIPAMQRRIQALAAERSIPPAEFAKLMHKRISTANAVAFCDKYKVSLDWLLCGDLKGLRRMTLEAKGLAGGVLDTRILQLGKSFNALSPEKKKIAFGVVQELMTRSLLMAKAAKRKRAPKAADAKSEAKRAKAYADLEPHLCDVVRMGEIASMLFDSPDQGQFVFAVTHLEDMLQDLRKRYYALDFRP